MARTARPSINPQQLQRHASLRACSNSNSQQPRPSLQLLIPPNRLLSLPVVAAAADPSAAAAETAGSSRNSKERSSSSSSS